MLEYYLPPEKGIQETLSSNERPPKPGSPLFDHLTNIELHENNYKIISYGCSLNIHDSQILYSNRLSRYCISHNPEITSLQSLNWINPEPPHQIQSRFVAEMAQRIGVYPEPITPALLSKKLKVEIPVVDIAKDCQKRIDPRFTDEENVLNKIRLAAMSKKCKQVTALNGKVAPMEFDSAAVRKGRDYIVFVPSWGQYVRSAWLAEQSHTLTSTLQTIRPFPVSRGEPQAQYGEAVESDLLSEDGESEGSDVMSRLGSQPGTKLEYSENVEVKPEIAQSVNTTSNILATSSGPVTSETTSLSPSEQETPDDFDETLKPPKNLLKQTIEWSSADFFFVPRSIEPRRTIVSPLKLSDLEYLGDTPQVEDT